MADTPQLSPHTHRVTLTFALVGIVVASYALWRTDNTRDREDATRDRVAQLETASSALRAELASSMERDGKARAELQKQWLQLATLPQQVKELTALQEDLRSRTERPQRAWSRAEAVYLVELAQRRLSFDRDTSTAIVALESADARLASLHDAALQTVRDLIARQIQILRALPEPDRTGLLAHLSAIEAQIDRLPLKGVLAGRRTEEAVEDSQSFFDRVWHSIASSFNRMVSVRRINDSHGEIVALEEQTLRRQHLSLLTFAAKQALMRSDTAAFKSTITAMQAWLAQYFDASPAVESATQELATMATVDIAPPLPDISAATQLLTRPNAAAQ